MLDPDNRYLLFDALRPPPNHVLDLAVGTTYSLDLLTLMTAPVAFAMFDRQSDDGSLIEDPIATLQALREYAGRITLFCQAGQIAVPPEFRHLLVYLEDSVYPVVPLDRSKVFHPKVWYLRYRHSSDTDTGYAYRLLCLSRNLTFDRSWDTVLRLEGKTGDEVQHPELLRFADSLVRMASTTRELADDRSEAIRELGEQFARVDWTPPDNFTKLRFWPLGDDNIHRWPFEGRRDQTLVISPFVTGGMLGRLTNHRRDSVLVSRPETIDRLGTNETRHLAERLILMSDSATTDEDGATSTDSEVAGESVGQRLDGLHAKVYIADTGWTSRVWTGSANATDAAFHGNVEFLVELEGRKDRIGVQAMIGEGRGLRRLVDSHEPSCQAEHEPTEEELIEARLDRARRAIGSLRFSATCSEHNDSDWRLVLDGSAFDGDLLDGIGVAIRPVTLGKGFEATLDHSTSPLQSSFLVSEPAVTPYFIVALTIEKQAIEFLIVAKLIDPPPNRTDRVLSRLLENRADLIRFLLLLLGNIEDALAAFSDHTDRKQRGSSWLPGLGSEALLEPLIRAFSRDPDRLRDVERLLKELQSSSNGEAILPEGWDDIWKPIAGALSRKPAL